MDGNLGPLTILSSQMIVTDLAFRTAYSMNQSVSVRQKKSVAFTNTVLYTMVSLNA